MKKDSHWCLAHEGTQIHVDAANPSNSVTKAEARTLVKRVAHLLRDRYGIGASGAGRDVVLTVLYGSPFAPIFFYGLVAAGGVFSGASTDYQVVELVHQIKDANPTLLVCSPERETLVGLAARQCGIGPERILILDGATDPSTGSY